jgi:hypothetical protein
MAAGLFVKQEKFVKSHGKSYEIKLPEVFCLENMFRVSILSLDIV